VAGKPTSNAIKEFLGEAEEIIEKLNLDLVTLGDGIENADADPDLLNGIFRDAHSLKGLAGMFGFDDIGNLAHQMENLLDGMRLGKISLGSELIEVLFDALEGLTRLVHGKGEEEDFTIDLAPLLARIEAAADGGGGGGKFAGLDLDPAILNVLTEYEEHRLQENLDKGRHLLRVQVNFSLASFDRDLAEVTDLLKTGGEVISTLPSAGDAADRIGFQILVGSTAPVDEVVALLDREDVRVDQLGAAAPPSTDGAVGTGAGAGAGAGEVAGAEGQEPAEEAHDAASTSLRSISRTVRVDIDKLDSLMNVVGELVLSKANIAAICERLKADGDGERAMELQKATRVLERRLDELQKGVMEVRMVPVSQLFEKMTRIVRRVANELDKKVGLDIRGADTELDKLIVEDLSDPLMHIIRNAIDHGIETPADRLAAGKPEKGQICLWASQKGNHVVIEVRDDGHGIDSELVRRKAVRKGLVDQGSDLSRDEISDLILTPGFSTRDEVSDLSGRGVGMDVVKNNIAALSGMIEIDSEPGCGTTMTITLPITLAIIKALIVRVCEKTYAIPINSVMETFMLEASSIRTIEKREVVELRQSTLPLLRLGEIFNLPVAPDKRAERSFVAVAGLADKRIGIVVDELVGQQDVVIKSLGNTLSFVRGISGAADLGNQKTILVLDVGGLMSEALRGESAIHV